MLLPLLMNLQGKKPAILRPCINTIQVVTSFSSIENSPALVSNVRSLVYTSVSVSNSYSSSKKDGLIVTSEVGCGS